MSIWALFFYWKAEKQVEKDIPQNIRILMDTKTDT